ncbi:MAG: FAD-binding oxidoreductase [Deltaproteobacteria bacterium]|nr:FAD-binding oxidoreductase [Deltaproteobacteria bacterium]
MPDIVVIGAGVGAAIAYYAAKGGASVTLLDAGAIGQAASANSQGAVRQQERRGLELTLAMESARLWATLKEEMGADVGFRQVGTLMVTDHADRLADLEDKVRVQQAEGLPCELLDRGAITRRFPYLRGTFIGAAWSPTDGLADPGRAIRALVAAGERRGVAVQPEVRVTGVETAGGKVAGVRTPAGLLPASTIVIAAGPGSRALATSAGVEVPVHPVYSLSVRTPRAPLLFREYISYDGFSYSQAETGEIWLSGGLGAIDLERQQTLLEDQALQRQVVAGIQARLRQVIAGADGVSTTWHGVFADACAADLSPILGKMEALPGLYVATGFAGYGGFSLLPVVGKLMAELILEGKPSVNLDEYSPARFQGT